MTNYIEVGVKCPEKFSDILMQEMFMAGYDSFIENEDGFKAYITEDKFDRKEIDAILNVYSETKIGINISVIKNENWNKKWEEDYEAFEIDDKYRFRAPFHAPGSGFVKEFTVYPGMAFGTGHHETTSLMIEVMDDMSFHQQSVLDYGCGTGILSIFAEYKGAREILAIDNDEYAVESAKKNLDLNNCKNINVQLGGIETVGVQKFDIILANITRNIILESKEVLKNLLADNGILIVSGFLEQDIELLQQAFFDLGFTLQKIIIKNKWALCIFAL